MDRRIGFLGIILFFIVALGGFYIYLKKQQAPVTSAFKAVPINAALILDINNPISFQSQLSNNNKLWQQLIGFNELNQLNSQVQFIDSLLLAQNLKESIFKDKDLIISWHDLGNQNYKPVFYTTLSGRFEGNHLIHNIELLLADCGTISNTKYNQVRVNKFTSKNNANLQCFYCYHKGIFILSPSEILFQDAIRQTESDLGLLQNKQFIKLKETANQHVDANVYLQFNELKKLLGKSINIEQLNANGIKQYADWGELDLNIKSNTFLLNGYSNSANNSAQLIKVFKDQTPQTIKFVKYISNAPEAFSIIGISDTRLFRQNLGEYMEDLGQKERFDINEQLIRETFGNQAVNNFEKLVQKELAQVSLSTGNVIFAMQVTGYRDAKEFIDECFNYYSKKAKIDLGSLKKTYKIDSDSEFPIYKMPINKIPTRLFGPWFNSCSAEYLTIFGDYLVFSNTYKGLTDFIYNNVLQRTIAYNGDYSQFENYLSSKSNFYQFVSLTSPGQYLKEWLNDDSFKYLTKNAETFQEFYGLAFQFSVDKNLLYNNLLFRYQPANNLVASTQWESRLDTTVMTKPAIVVNHYTGEKEICVQDYYNTLYLVNKEGRILWKRKIEKPILGQIFQIDYYKNGKLQLLFSTEDKLYILDRNGNNVERYPIVLPEKATAPIALFDYENRKNYRIFVPINKIIIAYDIEGNRVSGFDFQGADHTIMQPMQYFRNSNKDYLVITDENRTYILDRKGSERVSLKGQFSPSKNNQYVYQPAIGSRNARLVTTNTLGEIKFIYFNGDVETLKLDDFSEKHFFSLADIIGDGADEYIYTDKNELRVYNAQGKKVFTHKFNSEIDMPPSFYQFASNKMGIGITESALSKIYLFDNKGKIWDGFPLKGKTRFSIATLSNNTSTFSLLVGGDNYYLYNYKLN